MLQEKTICCIDSVALWIISSFTRSIFYTHKSRRCIGVRSSPGRELHKKFLLSIVKLVSLIKHALGIHRRWGSRQIPRRWACSKISYLQSRLYTRARARKCTYLNLLYLVTFPSATELNLLHFPLLITSHFIAIRQRHIVVLRGERQRQNDSGNYIIEWNILRNTFVNM